MESIDQVVANEIENLTVPPRLDSHSLLDLVIVKLNDIVCWIFRSLRQYNVQWVESIDQVVANEIENLTVPPRYGFQLSHNAGV